VEADGNEPQRICVADLRIEDEGCMMKAETNYREDVARKQVENEGKRAKDCGVDHQAELAKPSLLRPQHQSPNHVYQPIVNRLARTSLLMMMAKKREAQVMG
jgi:hypothetical protein